MKIVDTQIGYGGLAPLPKYQSQSKSNNENQSQPSSQSTIRWLFFCPILRERGLFLCDGQSASGGLAGVLLSHDRVILSVARRLTWYMA